MRRERDNLRAGRKKQLHTHYKGQILVATAGTGYYQEQGQAVQLVRAGEAVNIGPGVVH